MRIRNVFLASCCLLGAAVALTGCDEDDYLEDEVTQTPVSQLTEPQLERNLTATTSMDLSLRCRFSNGGDTWENMKCTVHWRTYSSKPTTSPKASDMTNHESMSQYAIGKYNTTFDKSHSGFNGGNYIYYHFECGNSKHTTKTSVTYCVIKR